MSKMRADRLSRFACQRCGQCCKGNGVVNLKAAETAGMAAALGLPSEEFLSLYTRPSDSNGCWLIDRSVDDELWCVFLQRDAEGLYGCRVQAAKPAQCRNFPYTWRTPGAERWCRGLNA
jgi:Fe-S-cluster containining protein